MFYSSYIENGEVNQNKFFAKNHAHQLDLMNVSLYSTRQITSGDKLKRDVTRAFPHSRVFRNFRKNFIAVKVEDPRAVDRNSEAAQKLIKRCNKEGITVHRSANALIFRIPRPGSKRSYAGRFMAVTV